jgi:CheY-like chemotaxis protein
LATPSSVLRSALLGTIDSAGGFLCSVDSAECVENVDVLLVDHALMQGKPGAWLDHGVPVVALAPQEDRDAIETYTEAGCAGWLLTPLRRASVLQRLAILTRGAAEPLTGSSEDERAAPTRTADLRVLLAEDNPVNALLARALLERNGCSVMTVGTGVEAIAALESGPYDIVLMDLHMPELDGFGATAAIRAMRGSVARIPIIALTAAASEEDRRACRAAGMDDFITKPLDPRALELLLARWTRPPERATVAA